MAQSLWNLEKSRHISRMSPTFWRWNRSRSLWIVVEAYRRSLVSALIASSSCRGKRGRQSVMSKGAGYVLAGGAHLIDLLARFADRVSSGRLRVRIDEALDRVTEGRYESTAFARRRR